MTPLHLKPWRRQEIEREDWDFSELLDSVAERLKINERIEFLRWAWMFEVERELNSGNPPFIRRWREAGRPWPFDPRSDWAMRKHPLGRFLEKHGKNIDSKSNYVVTRSPGHPYADAHIIEIDWSQSKEQIVQDFLKWLDDIMDHPPTDYKKTKGRAGRRDSYRSWFNDLSIFRLGDAGYTRREAIKLAGLNEISSPNWAHAKQRTLNRIDEVRWSLLCRGEYLGL